MVSAGLYVIYLAPVISFQFDPTASPWLQAQLPSLGHHTQALLLAVEGSQSR